MQPFSKYRDNSFEILSIIDIILSYKGKSMNKKSLTTYFMIPITICLVFVTIMVCLAVFSPKTYVLKIYSFDGQDAVPTYRAPQGGKELYSYIERQTRPGYIFDGYYFDRDVKVEGSDVIYLFDENDRVPEDYVIEEDITLYIKWNKA